MTKTECLAAQESDELQRATCVVYLKELDTKWQTIDIRKNQASNSGDEKDERGWHAL